MTGLLIGAVFGAVFVVVNAGSPLGAVESTVLRVVACLGAAGVLAMWVLAVRRGGPRARPTSAGGRGAMFSPKYAVVVVAEVVLLFGGLRALGALGWPEQGNVAWVAFVVGAHFVALAPIWRDWSIGVTGAVLTVLGGAGLVMAGVGAVTWVPFVSGVLSGAVLLGAALTYGWRGTVRTATV